MEQTNQQDQQKKNSNEERADDQQQQNVNQNTDEETPGTGLDPERSTKEGAYPRQSDDPTMHPSSMDDKK